MPLWHVDLGVTSALFVTFLSATFHSVYLLNQAEKMLYFAPWPPSKFCVCVRLTSAKPPAAVITEGKKLSEDEDEQFVVLEAAPPPPDMPEMVREYIHTVPSESIQSS